MPKALAPKSPLSPLGHGQSSDWADWLIALACIALGVAGLRAVSDPVLWNELARREGGASQPMGTLVRKGGAVRFRAHGSPMWHDLASGSRDVSAGDTVFTGDDGQAELRLLDGSSAEVQPGSLIVVGRAAAASGTGGWLKGAFGSLLRGSSRESVLKVEKGTAKLNLKTDSRPVRLQIRDKVYQLTSGAGGSSAEVTVDGSASARLTSGSAGKVEVREGRGAVQFGAGETAVLRDGTAQALRVQSLSILPLRPAPGDQLVGSAKASVAFTWRWDPGQASRDAASDAAMLEVESVSASPSPFSGKFTVSGASQLARAVLAPGTYRWRLAQGEGTARVETAWRTFSRLELAAPARLGPLPGAVVAIRGGKPTAQVAFSWRALPAALETELEWFPRDLGEASRAEGASRVRTRHAGHAVELPPGDYAWRVRAAVIGPSGKASEWSDASSFTVVASGDAATEAPPVILAKAPAMPEPVLVPAPAEVAPPPPPPAPAPVKVAAPRRMAVRKAAPKPIVIQAPLPKLSLGSASGSTRLGSAERLDQLAIPLSWQPLPNAKSYVISIQAAGSDGKPGKLLLTQAVTRSKYDWTLKTLDQTRFSYQVTAVLGTGQKVASTPVPIEIRMTPPPPSTPQDGATVRASRQGSILLTWERTVLTDRYELQVSSDASFKRIVAAEVAVRNLTALRALKPGKYHWRVRALAGPQVSAWSRPSSFELRTQDRD